MCWCLLLIKFQALSCAYTHLCINGSYINFCIIICAPIYKELRLYIKKQHVFLLCNEGFYSIYTFQIKLKFEF